MLMLVGDPEPVWARGTVDDVSSLPADDWHHGDPPGHGTIGLSNGVTLTVLPEGGARAFSVVGTEGRLEIVNEARQAYHISFESGASSAPSLLPGIDPRYEDPEYDSSWSEPASQPGYAQLLDRMLMLMLGTGCVAVS